MGKNIFIYMLAFFAITFKLTYGQVIVIDPGHNDGDIVDCDATPVTGNRTSTEVNTNWDVAVRLENMINDYCFGWLVKKTKNSFSEDKSIAQREQYANDVNDAETEDVYFLSIHCNAGGGTTAHNAEEVECDSLWSTGFTGTESFYCDESSFITGTVLQTAQNLTNNVQSNMVLYGDWTDRERAMECGDYSGTGSCSGSDGNMHLCVLNGLEVPHCLNEIGFQDIEGDAEKLNDPGWRHSFAYAYFEALKETFGQENDLSVSFLELPRDSGAYSANEDIKVRLKNNGDCLIDFGDDSLTIRVVVSAPGMADQVFVSQITSGVIEWNGELDVTITNNCDLSAPGSYCFNAFLIEGQNKKETSGVKSQVCIESGDVIVLSASITADNQSGVAPVSVQFNSGQSTGNIISRQWDFDNDPVTIESYEQNPYHTFLNPGNYTVQLTVSDGVSSNSATQTIIVSTPGELPVADFIIDQQTFVSPFILKFEDTSTGSPTSWNWDLHPGDPLSSTEQDPLVTYSMYGTKSVTLTVYNAYGSHDVTKEIYISYDPPVILTPAFTYENLNNPGGTIYPGNYIEFTDASSGGAIDYWTWIYKAPQMIDPEVVSGQEYLLNHQRTFTAGIAGTHSMELCVMSGDEEFCTKEYFEVQYFQNYDIYPQMGPLNGCACGRTNQELTYVDQSTANGPITGLRIDWGDGSSDRYTQQALGYPPPDYPNVYHTYFNPGHYNYHYWIFGDNGKNEQGWGGFNAVDCNSLIYSNGLGDAVYDTYGGVDTYYAGRFIMGTYIVRSGKDLKLNACNSIKLQPGFKTEPNSHFVATASDPCLDAGRPGRGERKIAKEPKKQLLEEPIDEVQEEELNEGVWDMLVYPNPNTGEFNILFGGDIETIDFVEVIDMMGKVVFKKYNVQDNLMEMDLSNGNKGMYIIRTVVNGELVVQKVVLK